MNAAYTIFYERNHILGTLMKTLTTFLDNIPFPVWHISSSELVSQFSVTINK